MPLRFSKTKLGDYKNCPRKFYISNFTLMGKQRPDHEPDYLTNGKLCHTYFENYNLGIPNKPTQNEFVIVNVSNFTHILDEYGLGRATYAEQKIYDPERDLVGVVDAVYHKDTEHWLIDYKTGKFRKDKMTDMRFELYLYVYLVEKYLKLVINKIGMFYTQFPECSFVEKVSRKKIESNLLKYDKMVNDINELKFPRIRGPLCNYCDYIYACESFKDDIID